MRRYPGFIEACFFFFPTVCFVWLLLPKVSPRSRLFGAGWTLIWVIIVKYVVSRFLPHQVEQFLNFTLWATAFSVVGFGAWQLFSLGREALVTKNAQTLNNEAEQFFEQLETLPEIPTIDDGRLLTKPGEFIVYRGAGELFEYKSSGITYSEGRSYRQFFGGGSVFRGRSRRDTTEVLTSSGMGILYVTNQRIVVLGERLTFSRYLDQVLETHVEGRMAVLMMENLKKPISVKVPNPYIPIGFYHRLQQTRLDSPRFHTGSNQGFSGRLD